MKPARHYTPEQEQYLRDNYGKISLIDLAKHIGTSPGAIGVKAVRLGLTGANNWTDKDIQYLKDNYGKIPKSEIAKKLKRTEMSISCKAQKMKLFYNNIWTDEQIEYLKANYPTTDMQVIIDTIGKSYKAITPMASRLGVKRIRVKKEKVKKPKITSAIIRVAKPKPEVKVKERVIVPTEPFRVNKKTVLYIPVGTTEEKKQRLFELYNKNKVA